MSKIERKSFKIFGETASEENIGQFGSAIAGTKLNTGDIEEIQALPAWSKGWEGATVGENRYPAMQERTGVDKVFSYQIAYMLQQGIPEWGETTNYAVGSVVKNIKDGIVSLYVSLTNENIGNAVIDTTHWQIMGQANIDLSNLSPEGQAKLDSYVKKSGDTMTGNLGFQQAEQILMPFNRTDIEVGTTGNERQNVGGYIARANGTNIAFVQGYVGVNGESGLQLITNKPDNSEWGAAVNLFTDVDGNPHFDFPKCTTPATTVSSAAYNKVAVVVQNYINGTSWYRVWSDGWIEQGGYIVSNVSVTATFPKPFTTQVFYANRCNINNHSGIEVCRFEYSVSNVNLTGMYIRTTSWSGPSYWYACGY